MMKKTAHYCFCLYVNEYYCFRPIKKRIKKRTGSKKNIRKYKTLIEGQNYEFEADWATSPKREKDQFRF